MPKPEKKGTNSDQMRSQRTALSGADMQLPEVQPLEQKVLDTV
jgi:hypothetical protein